MNFHTAHTQPHTESGLYYRELEAAAAAASSLCNAYGLAGSDAHISHIIATYAYIMVVERAKKKLHFALCRCANVINWTTTNTRWLWCWTTLPADCVKYIYIYIEKMANNSETQKSHQGKHTRIYSTFH